MIGKCRARANPFARASPTRQAGKGTRTEGDAYGLHCIHGQGGALQEFCDGWGELLGLVGMALPIQFTAQLDPVIKGQTHLGSRGIDCQQHQTTP